MRISAKSTRCRCLHLLRGLSARLPVLAAVTALAAPLPVEAAGAGTQTLDLTGSAFVFASEAGDSIGANQTRWFTPADSTFNSSFDGTHFGASITPPSGFWWVDMSASAGEPLLAGSYEDAVRWPFNGVEPGLSVAGDGRGCNTLTGRFHVARAEQSEGSLAFEASFEQHCEGADAALVGQIRIGPPGTDTLGPSLALPGNLTVDASAQTPVAYTTSAVDLGDSDPTVECTPASGSVFPVGTTTVGCTATDSSGNATTRSFEIRVRTSTPLSLTVSRQTITLGQSVLVTAHLAPFQDTDNPVVSLYATPSGGARSLLARRAVGVSGNLSVSVKPRKKTTFSAEWQGDDVYPPSASTNRVVGVHVITTTKVSGSYGTSGKYKLFHLGHAVAQTGTVVPNHAGKYLKFVAQRYTGGRWRTVATASFRIRSSGSVTAYFSGQLGRYRVRNLFAGDVDHLGDASPWRYLRYTS